ncbi:MAG: acetyl esterase/lipase [Candidatus Latescibacterota bacterium]|jgi:acetyl esterase/lipase
MHFCNLFKGENMVEGEHTIESNIVYGMYSGLALLMDAYKPNNPNGYGVIFISGSGWRAPLEWNAEALKDGGQQRVYVPTLTAAGYTVFAINHRALPRFVYPAAVEDARRAVRFVRHHANEYGIQPDRIGAKGGSSGGHLVSMLGLQDGAGDPNSEDPVEQESARVQCVVARAAPVDFILRDKSTPFLDFEHPEPGDTSSEAYQRHVEASPITYVTADAPPFLLLHGDADDTVHISQAEAMEKALQNAGTIVKFIRIPGGGHGPTFGNPENAPDYKGEMITHLDTHLKV